MTAILGALCVMTIGMQLMQMWHVDNLDLGDQVSTLDFDSFDTNVDCRQIKLV